MDFGLLVESLEGHFGGHFGARVSKWSVYVVFVGSFLGGLEKKSEKATKSSPKRSLFGSGRHGSSVVYSGPNLLFACF